MMKKLLKYYENGKSQAKRKREKKNKRKNVYRNDDMTLNYYIAHDCI